VCHWGASSGGFPYRRPLSHRLEFADGSVVELERQMQSAKVEQAIRKHLSAGHGIRTVATMVGVGSGTVQMVKREMVAPMTDAA